MNPGFDPYVHLVSSPSLLPGFPGFSLLHLKLGSLHKSVTVCLEAFLMHFSECICTIGAYWDLPSPQRGSVLTTDLWSSLKGGTMRDQARTCQKHPKEVFTWHKKYTQSRKYDSEFCYPNKLVINFGKALNKLWTFSWPFYTLSK